MTANPLAVFVPWLHMHQPPIWVGTGENARLMGNLEKMLNGEENSEERWNAQWFAQAYKNPAKFVEQLACEGHAPRIMLDYSGVLLEEMAQLSGNGTFANLNVNSEAIGDVIELFRYVLTEYPQAIEFAGTAYSHCYFPATPERDHEAQIVAWRRVFADLFGEAALSRVRGFWLPEMGMLGDSGEALRFIRLLKRCGYEWLILPRTALIHPEGWSVPAIENQVHSLRVESGGEQEEILCVVRDTEMGIRQQSGHNADGCINDVRYRGQVFKAEGKALPPLVVPTSDGENGNVMMFEYFPNTFAPLFRNAQNYPEIAFMTVSEYIDRFVSQGATNQLRLNTTGGSWIGGHHSWLEGDERQQILREIEQLSQDYAQLKARGYDNAEAARSLLLCETSCFVYWNSPFWFEQGKQMIAWAKSLIGAVPVRG